jgi:lipopolysaccharide/colanic/teichoic acid biosynthesis glycosyltransferase
MLPASGIEASESVLADLLFLAAQRGIKLHGEAFVYPESEERGTRTRVSEKTLHATSRSPSVPLALMVADYPRWKRALDVSGALAGLMLAFPVFVIVAVLIKLTSRGPIFFCQDRTGYLGRPFTIIKFRSMVDNAEELKAHLTSLNERDGPAFKMRRDPRITRFGSFLRCTGLDELPQLINVIRGDMSLVGPRPLPIQEAEQCLTWQKQRQEVKPGLTCYWQLAKSRQVAFTDWMRLDLQYARRLSFRLDLQLIFRTFSAIFLGKVGH